MSPPNGFGEFANSGFESATSPPKQWRVRQIGQVLRLRVRHESAKPGFESASSRARNSLREFMLGVWRAPARGARATHRAGRCDGMAKTGQWERQTMAECQAGIKSPNGGGTGSFCKKRDLCRSEGRCHFVARAELHEERMQSQADELRRVERSQIHWIDDLDEPDAPRILALPGVVW